MLYPIASKLSLHFPEAPLAEQIFHFLSVPLDSLMEFPVRTGGWDGFSGTSTVEAHRM